MARIRLGDLLVKAGLIDELQLQSALAHQRQWGGKLGDILVNNGFLDEMMLWRGLSKQLGVPLVSLPEQKIAPGMEKQIALDVCQKHSIFPMSRDDKGMTVATSDPGNVGGIDEIAFRLGVRLRVVLAPDREVEWALRRYYNGDMAPCPPPRLRRVIDGAAQAQQQQPAPPQMEIEHSRDFGQGVSEIAQAAARAQAQAQAQAAALAQQQAQQQAQQAAFAQQQQQQAAYQQQQQYQQTQPPTSTQPWTSPQNAPSDAELMIRETAHLLRFLVEACIQRGVFSRDDYLRKLKSL